MPPEAVAAPPTQAPTIVETGPPKAPPAPTSEIHVNPQTVDRGPKPPPPKKGSAQDRMFAELRKRAKPQFFETSPEADAPTPAQETPAPVTQTDTPADPGTSPEGVVDAQNPETKPETTTSSTEEKGKEKNPWKLVDQYKARASTAEKRIKELESGAVKPEQVKSYEEQISQLRKQKDELEKEVSFTNFAKSEEFKTKYQQPYEKAWARASKELSEIAVTGDDGVERPASVQDLADIVNLPLGKARNAAEQRFGPFADDVMGYRKEILNLFEQQQGALEEARTAAVQRDRDMANQMGELTGRIKDTWERANAELIADPKNGPLFREVEGDSDGNERLKKGFSLVDRAFAENPKDPRLTPEQRAEVVKRHAAVRLRAAAFGRCNAERVRALSKVAALEKELQSYKGSVPATGGTSGPTTQAPAEAKGWDRIRSGLAKIARPQ